MRALAFIHDHVECCLQCWMAHYDVAWLAKLRERRQRRCYKRDAFLRRQLTLVFHPFVSIISFHLRMHIVLLVNLAPISWRLCVCENALTTGGALRRCLPSAFEDDSRING